MKAIKIIDLLNKIANGEEVPEKIKIKDYEYFYLNNKYVRNFKSECNCSLISDDFNIECMLNYEVEIIKEKKLPEKIEYYDDSIAWVIDDVGQLSDVDKVIIDKLNDVIDYLESKEKGE